MKIRTILPAVAATMLFTVAGASAAQGIDAGASAGAAAEAAQQQSRRDRNDDRRERNRDRREQVIPNQSSTYGAGQVETDRNSTRATVVSGGQASGTGSTSATSTVDAYGETTRNGTSADIYGGSTANADEARPERRRPN